MTRRAVALAAVVDLSQRAHSLNGEIVAIDEPDGVLTPMKQIAAMRERLDARAAAVRKKCHLERQ